MDRVCPRDFTLLSAHEWGAATYLYCPTCRGVLLEHSDVEKIVQSGTHPRIEQPKEEPVFKDGTALCSCSDVRMKSVSRDGVTVDVCPACKAVWFDVGELERVVAENRRRFVTSLSAAPSVRSSEPSTPLEILVFALNVMWDIPFFL